MVTPTASMNNNRQESHRIYLQLFAPLSASGQQNSGGVAPTLHKHGSHEIHPPNYPTTTPGAPYQFNSSSEHSSQSSYSFSSLSTITNDARGSSSNVPSNRGPAPTKNRFVGYPSTVTTSAAVRLTDKARAKDVTALLRGKFGLPSMSSGGNTKRSSPSKKQDTLSGYYNSKQQSEKSKDADNNNNSRFRYGNYDFDEPEEVVEEVDALVLIGTIECPPKGYLRFEHEDFLEEEQRLEMFRHYLSIQQQQQQLIQEEEMRASLRYHRESSLPRVRENSEVTVQTDNTLQHSIKVATEMMARLPVSESTATVKASGKQAGWVSSSSMLISPSASTEGTAALDVSQSESSLTTGALMSRSSGAIGLDLSSSRSTAWAGGGGGNRSTPWGTISGMDMSQSRSGGKLTTLMSELSGPNRQQQHPPTPSRMEPKRTSSPSRSQQKMPNPVYEHDVEPIHIVRTVLPDEHPLHVRDEMMAKLRQMRQKAEREMGMYLEYEEGAFQRSHPPQPTFRWYFQPCSPLGGTGSSANAPKIQSIPAYIDVEGYCTEEESEGDSDDNDSDDEGKENEAQSNPELSTMMRQLIKEKQRIAMLRDLADPSFLVSGYLLKQSTRDPNVWRRVYCVLSDDRMWTIERMKSLTNGNDATDEDILSSIRVGRHKWIKLHRSLLLERGEGQAAQQHYSSRYNDYYLTPLTHRLPHTFRMLTSRGKTHTFRAFNSQSFRVWVTSLSEKIAQKHNDGMMDLANVIAEDETVARCRRMDDIAVKVPNKTESSSPISMDIVRFGIAVAAFRELCRHVNDAIRQHQNCGHVVNVQTRVGSTGNSKMRQPSSSTGSQRASTMEQLGMVSSVWDDARNTASKSAQLLHALATLQHAKLDKGDAHAMGDNADEQQMEDLIQEQKRVQAILGKHWDQQSVDDTTASLPSIQLFDSLLGKLQVFAICH